ATRGSDGAESAGGGAERITDQLDIGGAIAAPGVDVVGAFEGKAINALKSSVDLIAKIQGAGVAWGSLKAFFLDNLPESLEDRDSIAYHLVPKALDIIL